MPRRIGFGDILVPDHVGTIRRMQKEERQKFSDTLESVQKGAEIRKKVFDLMMDKQYAPREREAGIELTGSQAEEATARAGYLRGTKERQRLQDERTAERERAADKRQRARELAVAREKGRQRRKDVEHGAEYAARDAALNLDANRYAQGQYNRRRFPAASDEWIAEQQAIAAEEYRNAELRNDRLQNIYDNVKTDQEYMKEIDALAKSMNDQAANMIFTMYSGLDRGGDLPSIEELMETEGFYYIKERIRENLQNQEDFQMTVYNDELGTYEQRPDTRAMLHDAVNSVYFYDNRFHDLDGFWVNVDTLETSYNPILSEQAAAKRRMIPLQTPFIFNTLATGEVDEETLLNSILADKHEYLNPPEPAEEKEEELEQPTPRGYSKLQGQPYTALFDRDEPVIPQIQPQEAIKQGKEYIEEKRRERREKGGRYKGGYR